MHDLDIDLRKSQRQMQICQSKANVTSYVLAMPVFVLLFATVCEIIMYELPNVCYFECLTLKMKVKDVDDVEENWMANLTL